MRYIKMFKEDILSGDLIDEPHRIKNGKLKQEITDLFLQYSTYLIDNGLDYDIRIAGFADKLSLDITLFKVNQSSNERWDDSIVGIKWGDVKEDIIQLCHLISNKYNIIGVILNDGHLEDRRRISEYTHKLQEILDDKISDKNVYKFIAIEIEAFSKPKFEYKKKKGIIDKFKDIFKKK